ncbi:MAG: ComF family protein [Verrucomicrobia bacterium]|nr:ComF family protein [Verrucomicrobiota bacterium]
MALTEKLRQLAEAGLTFLYPDVCQLCHNQRATATEGYVCSECWRNVRFVVPPMCDRCGLPFEGEISDRFECANCRELDLSFSTARSAVAAKGMVLDIIHRWKYGRALWFEPFLANLLIREAAPALAEGVWQGIVPVPLHPGKQAEREFNQADHLARHLSVATQIPLRDGWLRRINPTLTQTRLTRAERAKNMAGAFAAAVDPAEIRGKRLIVVDDVLTTGATTSACAAVLRACGAEEVCVWTVARGLLD